MAPLAIPFLILGTLCAPARAGGVTITIQAEAPIVEDDARLERSAAILEGHLERLHRERHGALLTYTADSWKQSPAQDKKFVVRNLGLVWGAARVHVREKTPSAPGKSAAAARAAKALGKKPNAAVLRAQKQARARIAPAGESPDLAFDKAAARATEDGVRAGRGTPHKNKYFRMAADKKPKGFHAAKVPATADSREAMLAGVLHSEIGYFCPNLKNRKVGVDPSNYDPASGAELQKARVAMTWIVQKLYAEHKEGRVQRPSSPSRTEIEKFAAVRDSWENNLKAAETAMKGPNLALLTGDFATADILRELEAHEQSRASRCRNFVYWPAAKKKVGGKMVYVTNRRGNKIPAARPHRIQQPWPYEDIDKISYVIGPVSNPKKIGDVPVSDDVHFFFYCGVK